MSSKICLGGSSGSDDDICPASEIRQGESLELSYTYRPPQDLTDFICTVNVRVDNPGDPTDRELRVSKELTDLSADGLTITGRLTSGETNLLLAGDYWIAGELNNPNTGQNQETVCQFTVTDQFVFPNPEQVEEIVAAAEANPTPETQATAQLAVNNLPGGPDRDAYQARLDALDPEVANVVAARDLVVEAETYPWTSTKQSQAQAAVDALVSPIERSNLSARLSALNDEVAATDAVDIAEVSRKQSDITNAQILIDLIEPPENREQLQARLDAVQTFLALSPYSGSYVTVTNSYYISKTGLRVRSPNLGGGFRADYTLGQGSGWGSIAVKTIMRPKFDTFFGMGDILFIAEQSVGDQAQGLGNAILIGTDVYDGGSNEGNTEEDIILAVDYRGTNPIVYVIGASGGTLIYSSTLPITGVCSFGINTRNASNSEREYFYEVNVGSDLTNRPFPADGQQILDDAGVPDTTGYVIGWGQTQNLSLVGEPTFVFTTPAPVTPAVGVPFSIGAQVIDTDGLDRSSLIRWRNKFDNWALNNNVINGATINFTPEAEGYYEFVAEFEDQTGKIYTIERAVLVGTAPLAMPGNLAFDPGVSYPTITFNNDVPPFALNSIPNNGAQYNNVDVFKKAALSNIPIWGAFRYFEIKITNGVLNDVFGNGLMSVLNGNIGWSGNDSQAAQEGAGGTSILNTTQFQPFLGQPWINGLSTVYRGDGMGSGITVPSDFSSMDGIIGMAVDYRDITQPPIIHVIHTSNATPVFAYSFRLWNARTPVRPMVYVNQTSQALQSDAVINGEEVNMTYDPITILGNAGIDVSGLAPFWGDDDEAP